MNSLHDISPDTSVTGWKVHLLLSIENSRISNSERFANILYAAFSGLRSPDSIMIRFVASSPFVVDDMQDLWASNN